MEIIMNQLITGRNTDIDERHGQTVAALVGSDRSVHLTVSQASKNRSSRVGELECHARPQNHSHEIIEVGIVRNHPAKHASQAFRSTETFSKCGITSQLRQDHLSSTGSLH